MNVNNFGTGRRNANPNLFLFVYATRSHKNYLGSN